jgi:hypothetical protein
MAETKTFDRVGGNHLIWFEGVIEDRMDPFGIGRMKVRVFGFDNDSKNEVSTESLPWSYPILPLNSDQGQVHTPKEGTRVVGFFRDGESGQHRYIFGTVNTRLSDG